MRTMGMLECFSTSWNGNKVAYYNDRVSETGDYAVLVRESGTARFYAMRKMRNPSKIGLLGDTIQGTSETATKGVGAYYFFPAITGYPYMYLFAAHNQQVQRCFADGHGESSTPAKLSTDGIVARKIGSFILTL